MAVKPRAASPAEISTLIVHAEIWRMHTADMDAGAIAARINGDFAAEGLTVTGQAIGDFLRRETELRAATPKTRLSALRKLEHGLDMLIGELAHAQRQFRSNDGTNGRAGAFMALTAVSQFIEEFVERAPREATEPLDGLLHALMDLGNGHVTAMLAKPAISNRPKSPSDWQLLTAYAAVAADMAMQVPGARLKQATSKVAKELHRRGYRQPDGKPINARTVEGWRAKASEGVGGLHDFAAERLALIRRWRKSGGRPSPDAWKRALDGLDKFGPIVGLRIKPPS
jgi:hypothetical protein